MGCINSDRIRGGHILLLLLFLFFWRLDFFFFASKVGELGIQRKRGNDRGRGREVEKRRLLNFTVLTKGEVVY